MDPRSAIIIFYVGTALSFLYNAFTYISIRYVGPIFPQCFCVHTSIILLTHLPCNCSCIYLLHSTVTSKVNPPNIAHEREGRRNKSSEGWLPISSFHCCSASGKAGGIVATQRIWTSQSFWSVLGRRWSDHRSFLHSSGLTLSRNSYKMLS